MKIEKNKKKGFTLVELLAVIVILAIILVIAVPQVMNVIKDTTKASLESSAKMVAAQVENQYTVAKTLGKEFSDTGSCMEDWAGLNETDYASCTYKVDTNGNVKVTIGGKGKFEGLSVCDGTRSSATATEEECSSFQFATDVIQNLLAQESTLNNGLKHITTTYTDWEDVTHQLDAGIRYVGGTPNNYVEFNNEVWRIIGLVDVETSSGNTEKLVKIIKDEPLINAGISNVEGLWYDSGSFGSYYISNMLNGYYINNSNICEYYMDDAKNCIDIINPISNTYVNMMQEVVLSYDFSADWEGKLAVSFYREQNPLSEWTGKIALIYPSDYGFASNDSNCANSMFTYKNSTCPNNNWLHSNEEYWTMSEYAGDTDMFNMIYVKSTGIDRGGSCADKNIRPVVYLKPNVKITGKGTNDSNIFKLSM